MKIEQINQTELLKLLCLKEQTDIDYRLVYFNSRFAMDYINFIALDKEKIVGMLSVQKAFNRENSYHIEFVTVDTQYHNQKIATKLIEKVLFFCKASNYSIQTGRYSEDGLNYLKEKIKIMAKEHSVILYSKSDD